MLTYILIDNGKGFVTGSGLFGKDFACRIAGLISST